MNNKDGGHHKESYYYYHRTPKLWLVFLTSFLVLTSQALLGAVAPDGAGGDVEARESVVDAPNCRRRDIPVLQEIGAFKFLEFPGTLARRGVFI